MAIGNTHDRGFNFNSPIGHQYTNPNGSPLGFFIARWRPAPAGSRGFLRKPADFASRPSGAFRANFHSLPPILLSDRALCGRPEVREVCGQNHYRSMGYSRTDQAVVFQHWHAEETTAMHRPRADHPIRLKISFAALRATASSSSLRGSSSMPPLPPTNAFPPTSSS